MTTSTDADHDPLTVIAYMKAASGKEDELREALTSLVEPTNQEEGCLNYDLHESIEEPGLFFFYENWESAEHLEAHRSAPHLAGVIDKMDNLLDEEGLKVNLLRRIA